MKPVYQLGFDSRFG